MEERLFDSVAQPRFRTALRQRLPPRSGFRHVSHIQLHSFYSLFGMGMQRVDA